MDITEYMFGSNSNVAVLQIIIIILALVIIGLLFSETNDITDKIDNFKLGLVASKKLGNAVDRNRAKRRVREAIRTSCHINDLKEVIFVLILKKTVLKVPFIDLKQEIEKFLEHEK